MKIFTFLGIGLFYLKSSTLKDCKPQDAGVGFNTIVVRAKIEN